MVDDEILRRLHQIEQELIQIEPKTNGSLDHVKASTDPGYIQAEVNALVFRMLITQGVQKMMPIVNLCMELEDFTKSVGLG
ncbi:hypothetical protein [Adonisia turfae]|uniref:Uncharacterized protein n=1 Tax=Adonisia turfae CCMR0081 TaxID=2292702 RepID=A0A6M0RMS4_9CYAN|nr:hypothetical protein [Adonisia turfae]NEZ57575.1 hypothetical protein [Adonisia turfae CCMR0081]